jgi:hypothetical protein
MSQLDRHVAAVQNRLALAIFFRTLAWTLLLFAAAVLVMVGIDKLFWWRPPQPWIWIGAGLGVAIIAAIIDAVGHRPSKYQAAAAIDQKLSLHEKISTALFVRPSDDPFAMAAVRDAEATAQNVVLNYRSHFPFSFPRMAPWAAVVGAMAFLLATYVRPVDLFGREEAQRKRVVDEQKIEFSRKQLQDALAVVKAVPESVANDQAVRMAKQELTTQLAKNIDDPAKASRTALKALQDVDAAVKAQIKTNVQFAQAKADEKMWRQIGEQPITDPGPVNQVRKELAQGDFSHAMDDLSKVVNNFDKMDKQQQEQAAQQMKQLAQQLQQQGSPNPQQQQQQQQQTQQQLQQMGLSPQQAQQAQQLLQQAANGDKQAQQQLQQMAQQAMKQMNNGQGPTPQQQQAARQMMQQMQASANNQAQAQQLAQAAQQMAQAMQQQQAQQQQPGQGQHQQTSAGQQQAQAQQGQQGQGQQGMSQAMQQMQAQLQQMQAVASDAQQIAAAQQGIQQGAQQAMNNANGGQGGQDRGQGQWGADANSPPPGAAGKGQGQGGGGGQGHGPDGVKAQAPYTLKQEVDPSERIDSGKLLAATFVKASALKGENKLELKQIAVAAEKDETDEIDQDRISRQAAGVVREYFNTMQKDAEAPATQP